MESHTIDDYHVGWICAIPEEMAAAKAMLDEIHEMNQGLDSKDTNSYTLGRIHNHNVVIACLPGGVDGAISATTTATNMTRSFTKVRFGLLIGIGAGIPDIKAGFDIRLGDIVVSQPDKVSGGVVQYDKGRRLTGGRFELQGMLNQPPTALLTALNSIQADHDLQQSLIPGYLDKMVENYPIMRKRGYTCPGPVQDLFHCATCGRPIDETTRDDCRVHQNRSPRDDAIPMIHYGIIASGTSVIENSNDTEILRTQFKARCVETEASGLMNNFPCLVVRGICNYADNYKTDRWNRYAAATAAAYAKELLLYVSAERVSREKPIKQIIGLLGEQVQTAIEHLNLTKDHIQVEENRYSSKRERKCHQVFKTSRYEDFKNRNPDRVEGTCQWVLGHPQYRKWVENTNDDLLWISADPGCGKSVMAKSLIDYELQTTANSTVCYFFFKDNGQQDRLTTALSAILHQLFDQRRDLIQHAIPSWEKNGDELSEEVGEMWRILLSSTTESNQTQEIHCFTCVIDGLDECELLDQRRLIRLLTKFYHQISLTSTTRRCRLKFLITSRPYFAIEEQFQEVILDLPHIRIRGEEENDQIHEEINLVIRTRIDSLAAELSFNPTTKNRLLKVLLDMRNRTYLWLYLTLDEIKQTYYNSLNPDSVQPEFDLIRSIPPSVDDAYDKILQKITMKARPFVAQILEIVVGARRPLTVKEMAVALAMSTSPHPKSINDIKSNASLLGQRIRQWCGLFIFINHSRIYLIHQTAKEYLTREMKPRSSLYQHWNFSVDVLEVERKMARICVEFLALEDLTGPGNSASIEILRDRDGIVTINLPSHLRGFFEYASEYWPKHFLEADVPMDDSLVGKAFILYDSLDGLWNRWFPIFQLLTALEPGFSPIHIAAMNGHAQMIRLMLELWPHMIEDQADESCHQTALMWASENGHLTVVRILLDMGADVNIFNYNGRALEYASMYGHLEIVNLLLDWGTDIDGAGEYFNALQQASMRNQQETVLLLLQKGADIDASRRHFTALQLISRNGPPELVRLLLENGANVNASGGSRTPLVLTSYGGSMEIATLLIEYGADLNSATDTTSPIQVASRFGRLEMVRLFLENGAYVDGSLISPTSLENASKGGHLEVAQLLIDAGADVNHGVSRIPLWHAWARDQLKMVELLIENGADVDTLGDYSPLLRSASAAGHVKIIRLLLEKGVDVNAVSIRGTALSLATQNGQFEAVKMLVDAGAMY